MREQRIPCMFRFSVHLADSISQMYEHLLEICNIRCRLPYVL